MRKQIAVDASAHKILLRAKELSKEDGIDYPSLSDGIRSMGKRCFKEE